MAYFKKRTNRRGDTVWLIQVFCGHDPDTGLSIMVNETVHSSLKKDAKQRAAEILAEHDRGELIVAKKKATVNDLLDDLIRSYEVNQQDVKWARLVAGKHLRPAFGLMPACKLTTTDVERFITVRLKAGAAAGTVNSSLALLRRAYRLGLQCSPPKVSKIPHFRLLKLNNVRAGFFEYDQYVALREALPEEVRPILTFGYFTGCRRGEILALQWSQVDLTERLIRLDPGTTKSGEGRMIPLAREVYETLAIQRSIRDQLWPACPWVFHRLGKPIKSFKNAWTIACRAATKRLAEELAPEPNAWEMACQRLGLWRGDEKTGKAARLFHDLRRSAVRDLVRAGVPEKTAMGISGHKTRAVFDRYDIIDERDLRTAVQRLSDYRSPKDQPENQAEISTKVQQTAEGELIQ